jgi:hypothetical protein
MSFIAGLDKTAVMDLSSEAMITALAPMQTAVPGTSLRASAETGQRKKMNTRTFNVYNEGRSANPSLKHDANNSRHGGGKSSPDNGRPSQEP